MIQLSDKLRNELAAEVSVQGKDLTYLAGGREDSDGTVYTFEQDGKKRVLKIVAKDTQDEVERARLRLEYAAYLGECGLPVACPVVSGDGSAIRVVPEEKNIFLVSVMDFIDGKIPATEELDRPLLTKWGELMGIIHRAVKEYPVWKNLEEHSASYGHEDEINGFIQMCRNEVVRKEWEKLKKEMSTWKPTRDNYGIIHNDNHQNNIIVNNHQITLIDFDCAGAHFFANDIFLPMQGLLFDVAGGFNRPLENSDSVKRFMSDFMDGYEKTNHLDEVWYYRMTTLLNYRRVLLYTVMQDWMEADANARQGFLNMIENPCILEF